MRNALRLMAIAALVAGGCSDDGDGGSTSIAQRARQAALDQGLKGSPKLSEPALSPEQSEIPVPTRSASARHWASPAAASTPTPTSIS